MRTYFDHNATTPVDPDVLEEMLPLFRESFGNPSSIHSFGQDARRALDLARERVASLLGAHPEEITFTSGGTESNNFAIKGFYRTLSSVGSHIVTSQVEHSAVLEPIGSLEEQGARVTRVAVDTEGRIDPSAVEQALEHDTIFVSAMLANNDVGTIQPVKEICEAVHKKNVIVHCDAIQGVGKIEVNLGEMGVDAASVSSHKINGPKGVGALFLRRGTDISPLIDGGQQEYKRRGGTENIPAIAGFGKACELAGQRYKRDAKRVTELRNNLQTRICAAVEGVTVHGAGAKRLPGTLNLSVTGVEGDSLVMVLDLKGVAVSTGAACSSKSRLPSHVLTAMGRDAETARNSIRISLGASNTKSEVEQAAELIAEAVVRLRED